MIKRIISILSLSLLISGSSFAMVSTTCKSFKITRIKKTKSTANKSETVKREVVSITPKKQGYLDEGNSFKTNSSIKDLTLIKTDKRLLSRGSVKLKGELEKESYKYWVNFEVSASEHIQGDKLSFSISKYMLNVQTECTETLKE